MPGMAGAPAARPPMAGSSVPQAGRTDHAMAGMDHTNRAASQAMTTSPPPPEPAAAAARPGQAAATLRADEIDGPATTSLREAARSAAMAEEMAGGGHGMVHGIYRQIDAGRDDVTPPPEGGPEGHQAAPSSQPQPSAGSHHMHPAPASPRPQSSPRADEKGGGSPAPGGHHHRQAKPQAKPSPSPDPHRMHSMPASPRPTPTPQPEEVRR